MTSSRSTSSTKIGLAVVGLTLAVVALVGAVAEPFDSLNNNNVIGSLTSGGGSLCFSKTNCSECLRTRSCAWCPQPDFGDRPRCFPETQKVACESPVNLHNDMFLLEERELTRARSGASGSSVSGWSSSGSSSSSSGSISAKGSSSSYGSSSAAGFSDSVVQISPQRVSLKLRINQEHRLNISYSQAQDYPIDLYYLMDLSKSMDDDKKTLSKLGNKLTEEMQKISSNFRLGFGSFVDKVLMPYVSTVPDKLKHPCDGCSAPYGFRNHMKLNNNAQQFTEEVENSTVSGNLDAPEGGFDAIMQAIVCREQIGWRDGARRLLLFSTDAGFHYAGDGKLGGVITPNDGKCHLDDSGEYSYSSVQDYPSISHINQMVKQHSVNIIFAVTASQQSVYQKLSEHVEGSSCATLSNDSSNVVQLVQEEYNKISSSVEMKDNSSSAVRINYYSSCLGDGPLLKTNKCDKLRVGDVVTFQAEIMVTSCPADPAEWRQMIQIYPVGLGESMIIDLEMLCDCPCERGDNTNEMSPECNMFGQYKCGICVCDDFHSGRKCECSTNDLHSDQTSKSGGCRADNTTTVDCNSRGTCLCGQCECNKRDNPEELVQGQFCECDNFSCDRSGGLLCSGPEHGECNCGQCTCLPGWSGNACDCSTSVEGCYPREGGEICSGHGDCECGVCKCKADDRGHFSGQYCEHCPTCQGKCTELRDCVQCLMYKKGPLAAEEGACASNCTHFTPTGVPTAPVVEKQHEHWCKFYDENDCIYEFVYTDESRFEKLKVRAMETPDCPPEVFVLGIVFGVIATIVMIGLALLFMWKVITSIHDRNEFAKFEKERDMAKWDTGENPIYRQATTTFKNPTYAGK